MSGSAFVAREIELNKLKTFLDTASTGQTQIVFMAREAGAEDPSLNTECIRHVAEVDPSQITALGECNTQISTVDPDLPFHQIPLHSH